MNEALTLTFACAAGLTLGAIFFGGLRWTVRRGLSSMQPALWFFSSLILRTAIVLAGFYFVSQGHADRILMCLFGFVIMQLTVAAIAKREAIHAP